MYYRVIAGLPGTWHSSLVVMVDELVRRSGHAASGFTCMTMPGCHVVAAAGATGAKTLLIGVTFALLDFAAQYPLPLQHTIIMKQAV